MDIITFYIFIVGVAIFALACGFVWLGEHVILLIVVLIIVLVISLVVAHERKVEDSNIISTEIIDETQVWGMHYEPTGFSLGRSGGRIYYGKRKHFEGTNVTFRLWFGRYKSKDVSVRFGSVRYKRYVKLIGPSPQEKEEIERKQREATEWQRSQELKHLDVERQSLKLEKIQEENVQGDIKENCITYIATETMDQDVNVATGEYIVVNMEVSPNEYDIEVLGFSLRHTYSGKYGNGYRMQAELRYNPAAKGVTNRSVVAVMLDAQDRIMDSHKEWKSLDKSGSFYLDVNFKEKTNVLPEKVRIGLMHTR